MNRNWSYLLPGCRLEVCRCGGAPVGKGTYRGYHFLVEPGTGRNGKPAGSVRVVINARAETPEDRAALEQFLVHLSAGRKEILKLSLAHNSVELLVRGGLNRRTLEERVNPLVEEIVRRLAAWQMPSGCAFCDARDRVEAYALNGQGYCLCPACGEKLQVALRSAQTEARSRRGHLAAGAAGALLGGLLGMAAWFVLYQLGRLSALGGLAIAAAVCKGYELLGRHMDRRGVAVCALAILGITYLSNQLCWAYLAYQALAEDGLTFLEANRQLWEILEGAGRTGEYLGELILGYVFTLLGGFSVLRRRYQADNGAYTYQKL